MEALIPNSPEPAVVRGTTLATDFPAPAGSSIEALPLHLNFAWNATGNIAYALSQWGMLVALAKLTNAYMVGQFALGVAISTPILRLANLQLRSVQASDARNEYHFREYLGLRMVTTVAALAAIVIFAWFSGESYDTRKVIGAVALAKGIEALSDIYYGLFQVHDRLDRVGQSMMLKALFSVLALTGGLYLTRDVFWAVLALAGSWLVLLIVFDAHRGLPFLPDSKRFAPWIAALRPQFHPERQKALARLSFPLGIMMALVALNANIPRYFVHSSFGEEQLGLFSALAYTTISVLTLADALGNSATPTLARKYAAGQVIGFQKVLTKMVLYAALLGLCGFLAALAIGKQVLQLAYGAQYAQYSNLFSWLMASGAMAAVGSVLTSAMTAARAFRLQAAIFAAVCASNLLACSLLVPPMGLAGAAIATFIAFTVLTLLSVLALGFLIRVAPVQEPVKSYPVQLEFRS